MVSQYIYIYDLEFNWFQTPVFVTNNSLVTEFKNLNGHVAENWTPIKIKFRNKLDLDSLIFTHNNSLGTKLKIKCDT